MNATSVSIVENDGCSSTFAVSAVFVPCFGWIRHYNQKIKFVFFGTFKPDSRSSGHRSVLIPVVQAAEPVLRAVLFWGELVDSSHSSVGTFALVFLNESTIILCVGHLAIPLWWKWSSTSATTKTTKAVISASVAVNGSSFFSLFVKISRTDDSQLRETILYQ